MTLIALGTNHAVASLIPMPISQLKNNVGMSASSFLILELPQQIFTTCET